MTVARQLWPARLATGRFRIIVIIVTFGIGLVTVIPAVDEYLGIRARSRELSELRASYQGRQGKLADWNEKAAGFKAALAQRQAAMMRPEEVGEFRDRLVEMIRETDCQLRHLQVGESETRKWMIDDHPLRPQYSFDESEETPYELTTYLVGLTVVGDFGSLIAFLTRLEESDKHFYTRQLALNPDHINRNEIVLEMGLALFGFNESPEEEVEFEQ